MLKLLALGALGYAGYKYYQQQAEQSGSPQSAPRQRAVAGGPISKDASVQHNPARPPS